MTAPRMPHPSAARRRNGCDVASTGWLRALAGRSPPSFCSPACRWSPYGMRRRPTPPGVPRPAPPRPDKYRSGSVTRRGRRSAPPAPGRPSCERRAGRPERGAPRPSSPGSYAVPLGPNSSSPRTTGMPAAASRSRGSSPAAGVLRPATEAPRDPQAAAYRRLQGTAMRRATGSRTAGRSSPSSRTSNGAVGSGAARQGTG